MSLTPNPAIPGSRDAVYASVDPDSNKIIAMTYVVERIGRFIREDAYWRFLNYRDRDALEGTMTVDIERSKAYELVEMFDQAEELDEILDAEVLDGFREEEDQA
jgi:hypothetical protein